MKMTTCGIADCKLPECQLPADNEVPGIIAKKDVTQTDLKDSGERRSFGTGAVRDAAGIAKGRPSLRPIHAIRRLDLHMGKGAIKYAARNWEKGIPLSVYWESAQNHADKLMAGYTDEDHAAAWLWNAACFIETQHRIEIGLLPKELDDMPKTFAGLTPSF